MRAAPCAVRGLAPACSVADRPMDGLRRALRRTGTDLAGVRPAREEALRIVAEYQSLTGLNHDDREAMAKQCSVHARALFGWMLRRGAKNCHMVDAHGYHGEVQPGFAQVWRDVGSRRMNHKVVRWGDLTLDPTAAQFAWPIVQDLHAFARAWSKIVVITPGIAHCPSCTLIGRFTQPAVIHNDRPDPYRPRWLCYECCGTKRFQPDAAQRVGRHKWLLYEARDDVVDVIRVIEGRAKPSIRKASLLIRG